MSKDKEPKIPPAEWSLWNKHPVPKEPPPPKDDDKDGKK